MIFVSSVRVARLPAKWSNRLGLDVGGLIGVKWLPGFTCPE
jgi:hypothetical protein